MTANIFPAQVELTAVSPVAYILAKEGDKGLIKRSAPRLNEYRDKIGPASEVFLVFKGETKLGMIPRDFMQRFAGIPLKNVCKIVRMDKKSDKLIVQLFPKDLGENSK